jgi:hypothetical protein
MSIEVQRSIGDSWKVLRGFFSTTVEVLDAMLAHENWSFTQNFDCFELSGS